MEPGPILMVRVQIEGSSVLSGGVRGTDTSYTPSQLYVGLLELLAPLLKFAEEGARLCDGVGDSNFQLLDFSWGSKMTDDVNTVAFLQANERGHQYFFSVVGYVRDSGQHPIHTGTHVLDYHVHLSCLRQV